MRIISERVVRTLFDIYVFIGRNHLWKALYKDCYISSIFVNKHGHHKQFLFLDGRFLKIFSSETGDHINRNFTGIIYGRSSIGLPNFISLGQKHGRHGQLLFIEWIVLRVFDSMSKDLLYLLPFPWITWLKEAEKCQFPKFESFYFLSILMQFLQSLYLNGVLMSHYKKCYWDLCKII
jgi:hypothetical protein